MDPIEAIKSDKDTTFAFLLEAQRRNWSVAYMELTDLFSENGEPRARTHTLQVFEHKQRWFEKKASTLQALVEFDVILMRKDPPVNRNYLYATQLLELAERNNVLVVNRLQSLRDFNEKLFINWFPQCCVPTIVTSQMQKIKHFLLEQGDIIVKPLHSMGGDSVFRIKNSDPNINVILELLTQRGHDYIMAQRYIAEIDQGDKRILLINGQPVPYALARFAPPGETRANLAVGGNGIAIPLTERDRFICEQIGPVLVEKGLWFVGIDVIGDYLTEINITSPTGVRELDAQCQLNCSALLFDWIEEQLT
jgi:glutathione synthase